MAEATLVRRPQARRRGFPGRRQVHAGLHRRRSGDGDLPAGRDGRVHRSGAQGDEALHRRSRRKGGGLALRRRCGTALDRRAAGPPQHALGPDPQGRCRDRSRCSGHAGDHGEACERHVVGEGRESPCRSAAQACHAARARPVQRCGGFGGPRSGLAPRRQAQPRRADLLARRLQRHKRILDRRRQRGGGGEIRQLSAERW